MNIVDELLKMDEGKIEKIEKEYKIKLKKLGGKEFVFIVKEVDPELISEYQENLIDMDGKNVEISGTFNMKANLIAESCADVFRSEELLKKFKCPTPIELMKKIMTAGEIEKLYDFVQDINGFTEEKKKDKKKKLKN
ncbi:XkdN-like protein [Clostridium botulinum]|uniref:phage tail assembly chaperone n=1 Tax=Clostridium botulinum TaxID=1491 RepID=UPI001A90EF89|nr:XkdN-like protein [Clostridium botulinum]MBO0537915.1 XkdN-like protein [Clostridium botulinum]MBO0580375.1 XkdN-like protein [Clostridium botulinum]